MQKAVLHSPSMTSGKELPGLAVSGLAAPLWSLCSSALLRCAARPVKHRYSCKSPQRWGWFLPVAGQELGTAVIS